jgi:hypothetical protein
MNRLILATGAACLVCAASAFAQSNPAAPGDALTQPATSFPSTAIAQNFQYINRPPPPAPASSGKPTGSGRGHRHRQMSTSSGSGD